MDVRSEIAELMDEVIARVFRKEKEEIASHHELRFKEDLNVNSKHYFPILSALSDEFDLDIDYHEFQFYATTVESAIDYVYAKYQEQIG
ncbi:MAG: hypothetical protein Q4D13_05510 [Erysipelotrichaceae bacterium]|nr:hypothetical protein [Erysipelotrichaceae bacterium]